MIWGDMSQDEIKKFGILGTTFMFLIGSYWLLRLLKDTILKGTVGYTFQPRAKILSLLVVLAMGFAVAKLVDILEKQTMFYVLCSFFSVGFFAIAYCVANPAIGLANTETNPNRILGWIAYFTVESFGSMVIPLFWGFVASITSSDSAKRGYPIIFTIGQVGAIAGPLLMLNAKTIGIANLTYIGAACVLLVPLMIKLFVTLVPQPASAHASEAKKPKTGMLEGIRLIFSQPYLIGVLGISTLYEVVGTIFEYQMKSMAASQHAENEAFAAFTGGYGLGVNIMSLAITLLGTSVLIRKLGLTFCLLLFPAIIAVFNGALMWYQSLFLATLASTALKALSYALNNPSKEFMYIPTTKDVKFKAKSLIDGFGGRASKAAASALNDRFAMAFSGGDFITYSCVAAFGIIGVWMSAAAYVGGAYNKLTKDNKIIG